MYTVYAHTHTHTQYSETMCWDDCLLQLFNTYLSVSYIYSKVDSLFLFFFSWDVMIWSLLIWALLPLRVSRWPYQAVASDCGRRARRQGDSVQMAHARPVLPLILCWPHCHTLDTQSITHTDSQTTSRCNLNGTHSSKTTLLLLQHPQSHPFVTPDTCSLKTNTHTQTNRWMSLSLVCRKPNG